MMESRVEAHLRKRIEAIGGLCYKFVSPGRRHVPDRLSLIGSRPLADALREITDGVLYGGLVINDYDLLAENLLAQCIQFEELKAPGKKPTPGQLREHERLRELGFRVEVLDSIEAVDNFVEGL